ncbi:MAG TPA: hypothetical protein VF049_21350 [Nocardioidaceae bacterium]
MTQNLADFWTGFTHTWPIWLFIAALTTYAIWACRVNDRAKKVWRRAAVQRAATRRTLQHIADTDPANRDRALAVLEDLDEYRARRHGGDAA